MTRSRAAAPRRWWKRALLALTGLLALFVLVLVVDGWTAFGTSATGERRARMDASRQWGDGAFVNPEPLWNDGWAMVKGLLDKSAFASPDSPLPVLTGGRSRFETPPKTGLRVTWLGHSTLLIEIDGVRVLTDPVWGPRTSPVGWIGPQRWYPPPVPLAELPSIDAVLLSHDHYDHLDHPTIVAIKDWKTRFIAPLGVGAHLAYWGVPEDRIVELDWWEKTRVGTLEIACTPARHASGRHVFDMNATLWAGYALRGSKHRAYFSGDTGLFPAMKDIGERLGPFDVTMIESGAYDAAWPDWHLGPEQALEAHRLVRGRTFVPVHWGLFDLAYHGWTEPVERVLAAARRTGTDVIVPKPGQSVEPAEPPPFERWWPDRPWRTAEEAPVVATKAGQRE